MQAHSSFPYNREEGIKKVACLRAGDLFTGYTVNFVIERTVNIIDEKFSIVIR